MRLLKLKKRVKMVRDSAWSLGKIRRLADQTALATFDIEQIVSDMQSSVAGGVMEMDLFSDQVRHGVDESLQVSEHLQMVIEQVEALRPSLELATTQVQAQSTDAGEIGAAMSQLEARRRGVRTEFQGF